MGNEGQSSWQGTLLVILGPFLLRQIFVWYNTNSASARQAGGKGSLLHSLRPISPFQPPPSSAGEGAQHSRGLSLTQLITIFVAAGIIGANLMMVCHSTDLFLATNTDPPAPLNELRAGVASKTYSQLGWKKGWGEDGLDALMHKLASLEGRVSCKSRICRAKADVRSFPIRKPTS